MIFYNGKILLMTKITLKIKNYYFCLMKCITVKNVKNSILRIIFIETNKKWLSKFLGSGMKKIIIFKVILRDPNIIYTADRNVRLYRSANFRFFQEQLLVLEPEKKFHAFPVCLVVHFFYPITPNPSVICHGFIHT